MTKELADQVVVVTGASSGISRQTAWEFARHGSRLALAARDREGLETLAAEVTRLGGTALVVPTDVSDPDQMQTLAEQTVAQFGRIDTWVNNAGVALYATVEDTDPAELRRVVEVNLLGAMYGRKPPSPTSGAAAAPSSTSRPRWGDERYRCRRPTAPPSPGSSASVRRCGWNSATVPRCRWWTYYRPRSTPRCSRTPAPGSGCCPGRSRRCTSRRWSPRRS